MRRRAVLLGALGLVAAPASADEVAPYRSRALRDGRGKATSLAAVAGGKRLAVVVLKGTWCQVCIDELARLAKLGSELVKLDAKVVGLTHESAAKAKLVSKATGLPVLSDPKHRVLAGLELWRDDWGHPLPALVVFDRCGDERGRLLGRRPGKPQDKALLAFLDKLAKKSERCLGNA